jgi:hypothetical protein
VVVSPIGAGSVRLLSDVVPIVSTASTTLANVGETVTDL